MAGNLALVIDQAGAALELGTHGTVVLVHADGRRERVGLRALGSVVLHGDVKLSTALLQATASHGVAVTVLPVRGRAPAIGFTRMPHGHTLLRHRQHLAYADASSRIDLARRVILAKLESMAEFARQHEPKCVDGPYRAMRAAISQSDIAGLMGVEGAATLRHFENLAGVYERTGSFQFNGRSRQPPMDEPNALMSLAYALAEAQATQLALHVGLDVQVGFLHALHGGRHSLALDLIEPARPCIDAWVHALLAERQLLKPEMFSRQTAGAVRLTKDGRALFYPAWFREGHVAALRPMRGLLATILTCLRRHAAPNEA
jgi:CRISPR-associated protein Cas1